MPYNQPTWIVSLLYNGILVFILNLPSLAIHLGLVQEILNNRMLVCKNKIPRNHQYPKNNWSVLATSDMRIMIHLLMHSTRHVT